MPLSVTCKVSFSRQMCVMQSDLCTGTQDGVLKKAPPEAPHLAELEQRSCPAEGLCSAPRPIVRTGTAPSR